MKQKKLFKIKENFEISFKVSKKLLDFLFNLKIHDEMSSKHKKNVQFLKKLSRITAKLMEYRLNSQKYLKFCSKI